MKKVFGIIGVLSLVFLVGCSKEAKKEKTADKEFLKSFQKGLENRWRYLEKQENDDEDDIEKYFENMEAGINEELKQVSQYKEKKFEDSELQEKAISYVNLLNTSLDIVEKKNLETYDAEWTETYDKRTILIKNLVEKYNITFGDQYKGSYNELLENGKAVEKEADNEELIQKLIKQITYKEKVNPDNSSYKEYEAIVENTSGLDFATFSITINLEDKDGIIVENQYGNAQNWGKGQKFKFTFSTDKDFDKIVVEKEYIEIKE